jgi:hypothetical protein
MELPSPGSHPFSASDWLPHLFDDEGHEGDGHGYGGAEHVQVFVRTLAGSSADAAGVAATPADPGAAAEPDWEQRRRAQSQYCFSAGTWLARHSPLHIFVLIGRVLAPLVNIMHSHLEAAGDIWEVAQADKTSMQPPANASFNNSIK